MKIFILSGPGGVGKTTLVSKLFNRKIIKENLIRAISYTTRQRRPKEKNGLDYYFVSRETFLKLRKEKFFLETQKILDNYYGTPNYFYTEAKNNKKDLFLCIDVKGGIYLKKKLKTDKIFTIFILAPSKKELYSRLKKRVEKKDLIEKRLKLAKKELQFSKYYDYLITNTNLKDSLKILEEFILQNLKD